MKEAYRVKEIPPNLVYNIRQQVLRPGRPIEECHFQGDHHENTFHLGVFVDDQLTAVASFMKSGNINFKYPFQYQLRGMAVLPEFKAKGFGAALLREGEKKLQTLHPQPFLWFNARDYAIGFYQKFGYVEFGEKFDIPGVCEHIVMYRPINK